MKINLFEFQWYKDPKGYRIETEGRGTAARLLSGAGKIVRNSDENPIFYNAYEHALGLHRQFAALEKSEGAALDFVTRYGFLEEGDEVCDTKEEALVSFFSHLQKVKDAVDAINLYKSKPAEAAFLYNGFSFPDVSMRFNLSRPNVPILQAIPKSLISYIWLCLADEITEGRNYKYCRNCSVSFSVGKGTGRTSKAEYCEEKCKKAWHKKQKESSHG